MSREEYRRAAVNKAETRDPIYDDIQRKGCISKEPLDDNILRQCFNIKETLRKLWTMKEICVLIFLLVVIIIFQAFRIITLTANCLTALPCIADQCEGDWIMNRRKCYYFSNEKDTWNNSRDICVKKNSTLVTIDNEQELDFLMGHKSNEDHWIGLSGNDSEWVWVNGTLYHNNIFQVKQTQSKYECAYLNNGTVKSEA